MNSIEKSLSLDSLFSTIITLYTLFLLYFPSQFLQIINLSPVLISTIVLLLSLLRLGTKQSESDSNSKSPPKIECIQNHDQISPNFSSIYSDSFVEWDVRAPLEVIYEEENDEEENREYQMSVIQRYASLSMFYPESDSDSSSSEDDFPVIGDCESTENVCDCDREGLIEIYLDDDDRNQKSRCREVFDEDNMIEIDISPAR